MIREITINELREMCEQDGLVIQGCGGDLQEWVDGINGLLTDNGILRNGSKFSGVVSFQHGSLTNLLFPFKEDMDFNMGKLAAWRLVTHEQFGGTWLSDYIPNQIDKSEISSTHDEELEMDSI